MRGSRGLLVKFVYKFIIKIQFTIWIDIYLEVLSVSWSNIVTPLPHNERLSWSPGEICVQIYIKNIIFHMNLYISQSPRCLMVSWSNIVLPLPHNERLSWSPGEICVQIYNKIQFSIWIDALVVSWQNLWMNL